MPKLFYPNFFNDVFGPIMQPGSSGSFAGTSRVGRIARHTLKSEPRRARILFNPGDHHLRSLGNMMDDRAYLGGLQDFATDDIRLFDSHELARSAGISYEFGELPADDPWPGSVTFELTGAAGDQAVLTAQSVGGGMVSTYQIHGSPFVWQVDTYAVLAWDESQEELCHAARLFQDKAVETSFAEDGDGRKAVLLEFSAPPARDVLERAFPASAEWRLLPALLPVVTTRDRKPQLFTNVEQWREAAKERNISFVQAAIEYKKTSLAGLTSRIVAAGLGVIAFANAHASGASGCVGESGVCCAMASGAIAWLAGGDGQQVENAASMALQANLGIPCDPIPSGKEFPCITRTIRAAVTAPLYADLALAGIDPLIPYHEVLYAIEQNRQSCSAEQLHCGINVAPCAMHCQQCFQQVTVWVKPQTYNSVQYLRSRIFK